MTWDVETVVKITAPLLQAVSVAVTAYFAVRGLSAWRAQLIGKRKVEIAEEALVAAYKAKEAISYIRSSGSLGGEGQTRKRGEAETEDIARQRDAYFVPLERAQRSSEDFAELAKARLLCQVYFGPESGKPFDEILRARAQVTFSARMLVAWVNTPGATEKMLHQWRAAIWEGTEGEPEKDPITKKVAEAFVAIEALCREHLRA